MRLPTPICSHCGHVIEEHKVQKVYDENQWMVECLICLKTDEKWERSSHDNSGAIRFGRCTRKVNMEII